ncbi:protein adenylyltransferase SelO [Caldimonas brevitalea]|uniref:Protein nucleotidyltransferase YdiU n=1 Tax=Caldimonas brevitalea TaxID=413882 RepID=A0A0G3BIQ0_9BURK|nr:YdiU family protein [Caldimonas brevitalea]AKJ29289.1 Selenoprotein O and cysteine-containing protein [Caldimonas brevitalea]
MNLPPEPRTWPSPAALSWVHRYAALGSEFHTRWTAQPLPDPYWVCTSGAAAEMLGWPDDWAQRDDWQALQCLSGGAQWPGLDPVATVYSGHQFGVWAGQLGDGRALLLGEMQLADGSGVEVQLKGSGRTPYARMGDGRAVLRSSIREFLCSEAMHGLGIPTTRALCVIGSALPVRREQIETAAVTTRLAPSFVRFGHFEHFAHHEKPQQLQQLTDHVIACHYPECREAAQPAAALLDAVTRRTAELMAQWQAVGFCHGVMNTDNMSILGLTIDYGPFGFLDAFDPGHVCNHSDHQGRYAYNRQPNIALWNLHALGQALLPLIPDADAAQQALEPYKTVFPAALERRMRDKIGLLQTLPGDRELVDDLLRLMAQDRCDFTITFRRLAGFVSTPGAPNDSVRDLFVDRAGFDAWGTRYAERLRQESSVDAERGARMNRVNPKFVLRNHLAEVAIRRSRAGDHSELQRLLAVLERPYDEQPEHEADAGFPPEWAQTIEVSCSS